MPMTFDEITEKITKPYVKKIFKLIDNLTDEEKKKLGEIDIQIMPDGVPVKLDLNSKDKEE